MADDTTDKKMGGDKLAPHRDTVAKAIDKVSAFKDEVNSDDAKRVRTALAHMGHAHNVLDRKTSPDSYY